LVTNYQCRHGDATAATAKLRNAYASSKENVAEKEITSITTWKENNSHSNEPAEI